MTDPWSVQQPGINCNGESLTTTDVNASYSLQRTDSIKTLGFEDSFIAESNNNCNSESVETNRKTEDSEQQDKSQKLTGSHQPLPDSQTYLKALERKLEKLKKSSKLVDALAEKREDCLRSLVQNDLSLVSGGGGSNEIFLELEASLANTDSAVHNLYRQIQPIQPVTVGETVHIVKYDQLEEQRLEQEEDDDSPPASR